MAEKLLMLALSPTMSTGLIARWLKNEGDKIAQGDVLCEVETDKATMEYESPASGVLLKIVLPAGSNAAVGDLIGIMGKAGEDFTALLTQKPVSDLVQTPEKVPASVPETITEVTPVVSTDHIRSSPLARKLAELKGLNLETIQGSGPAGRIVKSDVEKVAKKPMAERSAGAAAAATVKAGSVDTVIPVSGKRRVIASRLSDSMFSAPHYYLKVQAEMDSLLEARRSLNTSSENKVSMNAFLIRLTAEALKRHPAINASWTGESIIQFGSVDIGIAVALPDGLITPIVRDCSSKGILQIDQELKVLVKKAREQALAPAEYTGATFTVSNLGSYGIEEFTAIINPPGSAILAIGEIRRIPVVEADDSIKIKSVMSLTLSCDHRVIDGAVGAAFLSDLKNMLQEPVRALY